MYFARDCKNLASTKKHLAMDLLLSSTLCFGSQCLFKVSFFLPFSCSSVRTSCNEEHDGEGKAEQFFTHTKV